MACKEYIRHGLMSIALIITKFHRIYLQFTSHGKYKEGFSFYLQKLLCAQENILQCCVSVYTTNAKQIK